MNALQQVSGTHRLSAVSVVSESIPGAENVTEATKGIFESMKEWVVFFWSALVTWIKNTWNATTFLFFRAVGWVSPEWGQKIETWWLYGVNFWQSYTAQSREAELQAQIDGLQSEKNVLETVARQTAGERDRLREENGQLRRDHEMLALDHRHLSERNASLVARHAHLEGERNAARQSEGLVLGQVGCMRDRIAPLQQQIDALQRERNALVEQVTVLMQERVAPSPQVGRLGVPHQFDQIFTALPPAQAARFARIIGQPGNAGNEGGVYVA